MGCTSGDPDSGLATGSERPAVDPDVAVAVEALALLGSTRDLVSAVGDRHPELHGRLAPAHAAHQAHVAMLDGAVPDLSPAAPSDSSTPSSPSSSDSSPRPSGTPPDVGPKGGVEVSPDVPRDPARALARVVTAEEALTTAVKRLAFRAHSGPFARLLGSIAASAAQHAAGLAPAIAPESRP